MKTVKSNPYLLEVLTKLIPELINWNYISSEDSLNTAHLLDLIQADGRLDEMKKKQFDDESTIYEIDESAWLIVGPVKVLVFEPGFDFLKLNM